MGIENSMHRSDTLPAWDIADIVKETTKGVAYCTSINRSVRIAIPYIAEKVAQDHKDVFNWNDSNGGNLTPESKAAIADLKAEIIKNITSTNDGIAALNADIDSTAIPKIRAQYDKPKTIAGISTYKISDAASKSGIETLIASYSYNRKEFEEMFCRYQNGGSTEDEDEDDEEDEYADLKQNTNDQDTQRFAHKKVNLNSVMLYYLRVWTLMRLAKEIDNRRTVLGVTNEDADNLKLYAQRIAEFPTMLSSLQGQAIKFRPDVLDILPVIVNFDIDSRIADNSTEDFVSNQFVVTLKLDMLKSPSANNNRNRPSVHYLDLMNNLKNTPEQVIGKYKREKLRQGYLLWYYIQYGNLPLQCDKLSLETAMEQEQTGQLLTGKFDPRKLSETLCKAEVQDAINDTFKLYQTGTVNIEENVDKFSFNWMDFFRIEESDNVPDTAMSIPVHFMLQRESFEKDTTTVFPRGTMTYMARSSKQMYTSAMLCAQQCLVSGMNDCLQGFKNKNGTLISAITMVKSKKDTQPSGSSPAYHPVVYDVVHAILTTVFLYCRIMLQRQEGPYYTDLFLPRISGESANDTESIETEPGSAAFMSALGRSLEQGLSLPSLGTHTQGYVAVENQKAWNYKLENAASSILNTIPRTVNGPLRASLAGKHIAIIYLTKFVCDSKKGADDEYSVLSTESLVVFGSDSSKIVFTQRTNDICRDSRNAEDPHSEVYNFGEFAAEKHLSSLLRYYNDSTKIKTVILLMNAPCKITTAMAEKKILGLNQDTIAKLESNYPNLAFFPMFISKYQVRDTTGDHLVIRNMYQKFSSTDGMIPLDAFVIGKAEFGKNKIGYYRSGCMYQTIKDYYLGKTGQLIQNYLAQPDGTDHISIETALLLLHIVSDERARQGNAGEGKTEPFDRLKNEIIPSARVKYSKSKDSQYIIQIHYLGLVTALVDILEKKQ